MTAYSHAYTFMDVTGDTVTAWMLLWRAVVAAKKLQAGAKGKDAVFYEGQVATARFFINTVLPVTFGKINVILTRTARQPIFPRMASGENRLLMITPWIGITFSLS